MLHAGVPARLRLINLNSNAFAPTFVLARGPDTAIKLPGDSILSWTLVAKDGFDVRPTARRLRIARQVVSIGETYDFEYRSTARGALRLEIWSSEVPDVPLRPRLLVSVPIRVE